MANVPITILAGTLPSGAVYNPQTYFNAIVARMTASISGGSVIFGQLGGTQPPSALPGYGTTPGLWYGNALGNTGIFQQWNVAASSYLPIPVTCGQYISGALHVTDILCGASSGNWKLTTPDKSGTFALTSDLVQGLGLQTYSSGAVTVNWATNSAGAYITLTSNATINIGSGTLDGMIKDYYVENPTGTTTYTVVFAGVNWPGNAAPTQSPFVAGQRVIDHYRIYYAGNIAFGQAVNQNYQVAIGSQTGTVPTVVSLFGSGNLIYITMNYALIGGSLLTTDWTVVVNGVTVSAVASTTNGATVQVQVPSALNPWDVVTVRYAGSDMKSLAGNVAPTFGPTTVPVLTGGAGVFNNYLT